MYTEDGGQKSTENTGRRGQCLKVMRIRRMVEGVQDFDHLSLFSDQIKYSSGAWGEVNDGHPMYWEFKIQEQWHRTNSTKEKIISGYADRITNPINEHTYNWISLWFFLLIDTWASQRKSKYHFSDYQWSMVIQCIRNSTQNLSRQSTLIAELDQNPNIWSSFSWMHCIGVF